MNKSELSLLVRDVILLSNKSLMTPKTSRFYAKQQTKKNKIISKIIADLFGTNKQNYSI